MKPARATLGLLVACCLVSCSAHAQTPTAPVPASSRPTAPDPDVTVVFTLQSIGPDGRTPERAEAAAHALDCVSYVPEPPNPGGPRWEVRLRVPADALTGSLTALRAYGVSRLRVVGLDSFSVPPDTTLATGADPLAC